MKLFEGGILDKITNDEYERMFQISASDPGDDATATVAAEDEKVDIKVDALSAVGAKTMATR